MKNNFENVFFIGGAGLYYDPFLGYGLNYTLESGYYAAKSIIDSNIEIFLKYDEEIGKEFKELLEIRNIWRKADNKFFDNLILTLNGKSKYCDEKINKILRLFME